MTTVKAKKASIGGLQLLNTLLYIGHGFTVLSRMTITITKYAEWLNWPALLRCRSWLEADVQCSCRGCEIRGLWCSPRIFWAVRAPSTSSPKNSINLTTSPSEWPSRFTWIIQRRQISSGNARRIFWTNTLPYAFVSSPEARRACMRRLHSMYVVFSASADANWIGVTSSK